MAAGQGFKTFATGDVLTAADTNGYLMQGVWTFASAAARDAAVTSPQEGNMCYLKDTDAVQSYSGSAWVAVGGSDNQYYAAKNKIINGDMSIAQRGTSVSVGASAYTYTLDRFKAFSANTATTVSRDTSAPTGFSYSLKLQRPNGNTGTNALSINQIIETANCVALQNKSVTVSFYVKKGANYSGGNVTIQVLTGTGTDQGGDPYSWTGLAVPINDSSYSPTTGFVRVSYGATIASTAKELAVNISYTPTGTAGADDALYITGLQLEIGTTATDFQTASGSIGGELALCQRYYVRTLSNQLSSNYGMGIGNSATQTYFQIQVPEMRVTPTTIDYSTLEASDGANNTGFTNLTINSGNSTARVAFLVGTHASGITQYRPYLLRNNASTAGYLGLGAEL